MAVHCDKCKCPITDETDRAILSLERTPVAGIVSPVDLCPVCLAQLLRWVFGLPEPVDNTMVPVSPCRPWTQTTRDPFQVIAEIEAQLDAGGQNPDSEFYVGDWFGKRDVFRRCQSLN